MKNITKYLKILLPQIMLIGGSAIIVIEVGVLFLIGILFLLIGNAIIVSSAVLSSFRKILLEDMEKTLTQLENEKKERDN